MYNLLVVDDELYAVKGITQGMDWSEMKLHRYLKRIMSRKPKQRFAVSTVDIVICDIEMPSSNGLDLLEWIKDNYPQTETIFVTGHADFSYARAALHLGSFDYLLKPVNNDELKAVVRRALQKLDHDRTTSNIQLLFESQKPLMEERFWQDFFSIESLLPEQNWRSLLAKYQMNHTPDITVLPILISVEMWQKELTVREEEIMEYALRNAAAELILKVIQGCVIQDRSGHNLVLLYIQAERSIDTRGNLTAL